MPAMRPENVPTSAARYWFLLVTASILGCNTGDMFAHVFGFVGGLPILVALLIATLFVEHRASWRGQAYYWIAIIIVRTAATNLADYCAHQWGISPAMLILAVLMAALLALRIRLAVPGAGGQRQRELARVDAGYWVLMLLAGTLGTVIGDAMSFRSGLGLPLASALEMMATLVVLAVGRRAWAFAFFYWPAIVLVRAAGTSVGDFFAHTMGLTQSTLFFSVLLVALVWLWKDRTAVA
jgi:uncharacterized membrane-anchored protein